MTKWSDLASYNYAKETTKWLEDKHIPFVPKSANPPNIPKARPIEDFWADKIKAGRLEINRHCGKRSSEGCPEDDRWHKEKIKEKRRRPGR